MTDDLVKRLREWPGKRGTGPLSCTMDEAADRIEKLEADLEVATMKRLLDSNRIEKLEAALREIAANTCCDSCREAALVARKALEGKDE